MLNDMKNILFKTKRETFASLFVFFLSVISNRRKVFS
jgi:hypothetical protein